MLDTSGTGENSLSKGTSSVQVPRELFALLVNTDNALF